MSTWMRQVTIKSHICVDCGITSPATRRLYAHQRSPRLALDGRCDAQGVRTMEWRCPRAGRCGDNRRAEAPLHRPLSRARFGPGGYVFVAESEYGAARVIPTRQNSRRRTAVALGLSLLLGELEAHAGGPLGPQGSRIQTSDYGVDPSGAGFREHAHHRGFQRRVHGDFRGPRRDPVQSGGGFAEGSVLDDARRLRSDREHYLAGSVEGTDFDNNGEIGFAYDDFVWMTSEGRPVRATSDSESSHRFRTTSSAYSASRRRCRTRTRSSPP